MGKNVKMICFDMDGTLAATYDVPNWLPMLRNENPTPYRIAKPLWEMDKLTKTLNALKEKGIEIRIVSWLSKDSTEAYKEIVRKAKREWLKTYNFPFDKFHGVQYGATKADSVREALKENETAILIDDDKRVREGWHLGETIDPTACNLIEVLENLL